RQHALYGLSDQCREQSNGPAENLGKAFVGDARVVAGTLHRAAEHRLATAREHVAAVLVQDRGWGAVRPRRRGHLAADWLDGERAREAADLRGPRSRGDHDVLHRPGAASRQDSGEAPLAHREAAALP